MPPSSAGRLGEERMEEGKAASTAGFSLAMHSALPGLSLEMGSGAFPPTPTPSSADQPAKERAWLGDGPGSGSG